MAKEAGEKEEAIKQAETKEKTENKSKEKTDKKKIKEIQEKKENSFNPKEKTEKQEEKKPFVQKPKEKKKPKAVNKIKKTEEQKKLQEKIKEKKSPVIRGHFGKKWLRRKSIKKWDKWRKPTGIDFKLKKEDGAKPKTGYRTSKEIRNLHPSGLKEIYVNNLAEIKKIKEKNAVIRIKRTIGKKNRKEILKTAKEMNLRVLN